MLTVGTTRNHIRHSLAASLSSDLSELDVINQAGRYWASMHPWAALERRIASLALGAGEDFVVLPDDVGSVEHVLMGTEPRWAVSVGSMQDVLAYRDANLSGTSYIAAVRRRPMPAPNLLLYSDAFNQAPWAMIDGVGTVVANAAEDPFTHTTAADTVSDDSVIAVSTMAQKVYPASLTDGKHSFTAVLRPEPVTGVSPPKSGILMQSESPASNGLVSLLEIQWGATPWSNAPTATIIGTNSGGATALTPVGVGEGYWQFTLSGYDYAKSRNYGRLVCAIQPTRAAFADDSGTEDVTQTGTVAIARAWLNPGTAPTTYVQTAGAIIPPKRLQAVLELDRAPSATNTTGLRIAYRGGWVDATDDGDELPIPDYCETLFLQIARAYARGWEDEDEATLDMRLAAIKAGPVFNDAASHDGAIQFTHGSHGRGSAVRRARRWSASGREFETDWSSYAGPQ